MENTNLLWLSEWNILRFVSALPFQGRYIPRIRQATVINGTAYQEYPTDFDTPKIYTIRYLGRNNYINYYFDLNIWYRTLEQNNNIELNVIGGE